MHVGSFDVHVVPWRSCLITHLPRTHPQLRLLQRGQSSRPFRICLKLIIYPTASYRATRLASTTQQSRHRLRRAHTVCQDTAWRRSIRKAKVKTCRDDRRANLFELSVRCAASPPRNRVSLLFSRTAAKMSMVYPSMTARRTRSVCCSELHCVYLTLSL